jgi:manganese-dependent inorganic pyrophosphatase
VGTIAEDLLDSKPITTTRADVDLMTLGRLMREQNIKTVPVVDEDAKFLGLVTIGDMALLFLEQLGSGIDIAETPAVLSRLLALRVGEVMKSQDLVLFEHDDTIEEIKRSMLSTRFRNYPVVGEQHRFLGMISRYNLLAMRRKQLILVDHNESKQAIDGIEEAEIVEIIDHHRVGDLQTLSPIYFYNQPVGSTCTLVAEHFFNSRVPCDKSYASLMLAGIMTDTMLFKSPTTTEKDRKIARQLEQIAGLNGLQWGKTILEKGRHFDEQDELSMITSDLKEYQQDHLLFAIAQIETLELHQLHHRQQELRRAMEALCQSRGYDFMCLMVTAILEECTELLIAGPQAILLEAAFQSQAQQGVMALDGVMSRKKQVVPVIIQHIRQKQIV